MKTKDQMPDTRVDGVPGSEALGSTASTYEPIRAKHTPGPWTAQISDHVWVQPPDGRAFPICNMRGRIYDVVAGCEQITPEDEANARLIAAATELLDALKHMRSCGVCAESDWNECEGGRAANAAIEKAEGL